MLVFLSLCGSPAAAASCSSVSVCAPSVCLVFGRSRGTILQQTDMPKICASVVDREKTLDDGFKFLINNFAGLDA